MPISHVSKVFAVEDCKISPMTADPAGGTTTYGTAIDVPGIKSIEVKGTIETKTLRGDNTLLDADAVLTEVTLTVTHAKLSLDVLSAFFVDAPVVDSGTAPNEVATWSLTGDNSRLAPFKLEGKTPTGGTDEIDGDGHLVFAKCILSSFPDMGLPEEDYATASFETTCFPALGDGVPWMDVLLNETATAIA